MVTSHRATLENFDVFITYHETPRAKKFAEIIKEYLYNEYQLFSFVAHLERNKYSADFDKVRESVIKAAKFFLLINTEEALNRLEIIKEFKMAYPHGVKDSPILLVLRFDSPEVKLTTSDFEQKTSIFLGTINQAPFKDESDLESVTKYVFDNEEYSPIVNIKQQVIHDLAHLRSPSNAQCQPFGNFLHMTISFS